MLSRYLSSRKLPKEISTAFKPFLYRINKKSDKIALTLFIEENSDIEIFDEIDGQLKELIKLLHPTKKLDAELAEKLVLEQLNGLPREEYGVWVYYPWSKKLVHILDEEEFILVRTNRNMHKITPEERTILSQKKVGIVGLSVGQSVAVTMAMERCCGEIRLADFDSLELTNLNRIRTPISNLGINKAVAAAREIAEIDPYIKTVIFEKGLFLENFKDFALGDSKLDLVVEECDSLEIKIALRLFLKEEKIPVIMDTSDKGMIDIERFDMEPDRPILHGLIDNNIDSDTIKNLSGPERMDLILKIVDKENLSDRLKFSLSEIGKTITTWPQLASSVTMGGAAVTDICRRIFLKTHSSSGRYYLDIEKLI